MKQQLAGMWMAKKYYLFIAASLVCWLGKAKAQTHVAGPNSVVSAKESNFDSNFVSHNSATPFTIGTIFIEGNRKTKPYIIERELPFHSGDSIYLPELVKGFEIARQRRFYRAL